MQQYFIKGSPQSPLVVTDKDTAKHMFSVMRLKAGDQVTLVFDDGIKRLAQVLDSGHQSLEILEELADNTELPVQVTIASGFPKGDKLEFITQKATELGACALWAFPADWSVAKWDGKKLAKKSEKLEKIAQGAAEQSKRNLIPEVRLFDKKADFQAALADFDHIIVAYEESAKEGILNLLIKIGCLGSIVFINRLKKSIQQNSMNIISIRCQVLQMACFYQHFSGISIV